MKSEPPCYKYSEEEREYVALYLKVLFRRDHTMPLSTVASNFYRKMPHHSLSSWRAFLDHSYGDVVDSARKRASIAFRTTRARLDAPQTRKQDSPRNGLIQSTATVNQTTMGNETGQPAAILTQDYEEDLDIISRYFAIDGGDSLQEQDEVIWSHLTSRVKCKTASSWEEFYNEHHVEVLNRYDRLRQECEGTDAHK